MHNNMQLCSRVRDAVADNAPPSSSEECTAKKRRRQRACGEADWVRKFRRKRFGCGRRSSGRSICAYFRYLLYRHIAAMCKSVISELIDRLAGLIDRASDSPQFWPLARSPVRLTVSSPSIHSFVRSYVCPFDHLSVRSTVRLAISPSVHPSVRTSVRISSVRLSFTPPVRPSTDTYTFCEPGECSAQMVGTGDARVAQRQEDGVQRED